VLFVVSVNEIIGAVVEFPNHGEVIVAVIDSRVATKGVTPKFGENPRQPGEGIFQRGNVFG